MNKKINYKGKNKLNTNILNLEKKKTLYSGAILISVIGIIFTMLIASFVPEDTFKKIFNYETDNSNFASNVVIGATKEEIQNLPRLYEGMTAVKRIVNKDTNEISYEEIKNPYINTQEWDGFARTEDNVVWKWIQPFNYRVKYINKNNNNEIVGYLAGKYYDKSENELTNETAITAMLNQATHFEYEYKFVAQSEIENPTDKTWKLHPAFLKLNTWSRGFWIELNGISNETLNGNLNTLYQEALKIPEGTNANQVNVSLTNTREFGAIKILDYAEKYSEFKDEEYNNAYSYLSGYLDDPEGLSTKLDENAMLLTSEYESQTSPNYGNVLNYPRSTKTSNNSEEESNNNFEILQNKTLSLAGDGIYETYGIPNLKTNNVYVNENQFLTNDKPFLVASLNKNNTYIKSDNGDSDTEKVYRRVMFEKTTATENVEIKVNANGGKLLNSNGEEISGQTFTATKAYPLSTDIFQVRISREGYTFKGWDFDPSGNPNYENRTINAIWEKIEDVKNKYTVEFRNRETNQLYHSTQVEEGGLVQSIPIDPKLDGYKFLKWTPNVYNLVINKNTVFYAEWEISAVKVEFYTDIDLSQTPHIIYYELPIPAEGILVKQPDGLIITPPNGFVFDGWEPDINIRITKNTMFLPKFKLAETNKPEDPKDPEPQKEYITLTVDTKGATTVANPTYRVVKGTSVNDPVNSSVKNSMLAYEFKKINYRLSTNKNEWYDKSLDTILNNDTTFNLVWHRMKLTARFMKLSKDFGGNSVLREIVFDAGTAPTSPTFDDGLPRTIIDSRYEHVVQGGIMGFSGWDPVIGVINSNNMSLKDNIITFYPKYEYKGSDTFKVKVSFDMQAPADEVIIPSPHKFMSREVDITTILPLILDNELPRRVGYRFMGFSPSYSLPVTQDTVFLAIWEKTTEGGMYENTSSGNNQSNSIWESQNYTTVRPTTTTTPTSVLSELDQKNNVVNPQANEDIPYSGKKDFILVLGTILTSVASVSYIKLKAVKKIIERNNMLF